MQELHGIAVSPGLAIGEAIIIDQEGSRVSRRLVSRQGVDNEVARWLQAADVASQALLRNRDRVAEQLGTQYGAIFSAQHQMLADPKLRKEIEALIRERCYAAEYAVHRTFRRYAKVFQDLKNELIAERANDIDDIEKRLLSALHGRRQEKHAGLQTAVIVLAHNLTPSEAVHLDPVLTLGFACEIGGAGSHTAIVAEAMEIPAVVGVGRFLAEVVPGDTVIVDGDRGCVIVHPDQQTLHRFQQELISRRQQVQDLESLRALPCETTDGCRIALHANIEFPREVAACLARGADGIGLYRTEFLYLGARRAPTEEDHFRAYSQVVATMQGRPVVIRTLDLGADKINSPVEIAEEPNPFLGLRSIRLSLRYKHLFRTQLRAILRASLLGPVWVMFPLVSTFTELRQARAILEETGDQLEAEGCEIRRDLPVGIMVEVPAAVLLLERFAREVDFFSIGTNDLIQYTLAVDRSNKDVSELYNAADPAILRLIQIAGEVARRTGKPLSLCGQMSANPLFAMLLLGLGLRSLSVPPSAIPEVKRICRLVSLAECEEVARRALMLDTAGEVTELLETEFRLRVSDSLSLG